MKATRAFAFLTTTLLIAGLSATPARAVAFNVETKLTASDAAAGDEFGFSVAISGNTAIVGAHNDVNEGGNQSGAAYLFDVTTGQELFKLTASDGATSDFFGHSVAISGNIAIVGAYLDDEIDRNAGSAYIYDVLTGSQLFKLSAGASADDNNKFGRSVAISGNSAIVGEPLGYGTRSSSGAAYLFDVTTGQQLFKLVASDSDLLDYFGISVAISGNIAIVGAHLNSNEWGSSSGAAYLFDVTTGQELYKLTASDASANDNFGVSVAISGNTAIVAASSNANDDGERFFGSAYFFDVSSGTELFKIFGSDTTAGGYFGISVAIHDNTAIIGAFGDADAGIRSGSAYLFDATTGSQLAKLTASDAGAGDYFGYSVAISGDRTIVGAHSNDNEWGSNSGAAYVFIPEPSSFLLTVLIGLLGLVVTRHHQVA